MLAEIERLARAYARIRETLKGRVTALQAELDAVRRRHLRGVRAGVAAAASARARLHAAVTAAPQAFQSPRTLVIEGIRVGFAKRRGTLVVEDRARVVELIRKHFPEQADIMIKTAETPVKTALARLPAAELKRLGVTVEETTDAVVVKPTDSEVDKAVTALLADAERAAETEPSPGTEGRSKRAGGAE